MAATAPSDTAHKTEPAVYTASEVAEILRLAQPTIYQIARENPDSIGAIKFGRAVRFRRSTIDRLAHGDAR